MNPFVLLAIVGGAVYFLWRKKPEVVFGDAVQVPPSDSRFPTGPVGPGPLPVKEDTFVCPPDVCPPQSRVSGLAPPGSAEDSMAAFVAAAPAPTRTSEPVAVETRESVSEPETAPSPLFSTTGHKVAR